MITNRDQLVFSKYKQKLNRNYWFWQLLVDCSIPIGLAAERETEIVDWPRKRDADWLTTVDDVEAAVVIILSTNSKRYFDLQTCFWFIISLNLFIFLRSSMTNHSINYSKILTTKNIPYRFSVIDVERDRSVFENVNWPLLTGTAGSLFFFIPLTIKYTTTEM